MKTRLEVCDCGSGKEAILQFDADSIPLCFTCENCYQRKMSRYRSDILTVSSRHYGEVVDEEPEINDDVNQYPLFPWEE